MNYPPIRRGQVPPADLINQIGQQAEASSEQAGYGVVNYPHGTQFLPPDIEEIWVVISGQGSGSGRGSSLSGSSDNYYAGNQGMVVIDSNGDESVIVDPSGLVFTEDINPLIEVNRSTVVPAGYVTRAYLSPSKNAWHFVFGGDASSGSGSGGTSGTIDCGDGSTPRPFNIVRNGNGTYTVTVCHWSATGQQWVC